MSLAFEYQEISIVVRGNFAPAMFQPYWFVANNLIRRSEAESAALPTLDPAISLPPYVTPTIARFRADWLWVEVTQDRLQIKADSETYFEQLRDLGIGLFTLLESTPVTAVGINRSFIYDLYSESAWHDLGNRLTPKGPWESILDSPGMLGLVMEGKKAERENGYYQVKVQPNRVVVDFGVSVDINDHHVLRSADEEMAHKTVVDVLQNNWDNSLAYGLEVADKVMRFAQGK